MTVSWQKIYSKEAMQTFLRVFDRNLKEEPEKRILRKEPEERNLKEGNNEPEEGM